MTNDEMIELAIMLKNYSEAGETVNEAPAKSIIGLSIIGLLGCAILMDYCVNFASTKLPFSEELLSCQFIPF